MEPNIKEMLKKQLELLSEHSKTEPSGDTLARVTAAMIALAQYLSAE